MTEQRVTDLRADVWHLLLVLAAIGVVTKAYVSWLNITNDTTAALSYLLLILFAAASSRLWVPAAASALAAVTLDYFFLPPVGKFNITDPQDWIAFFSFLAVSVVASQLHVVARSRHRQAMRLLEEQKQVEIAQRSIELKSALLASLAHDLRTPLTAIRVCVNNLALVSLTDVQRAGQVDVALNGLDRLTRLFQNMLEMTRIDAGEIALSLRWVHPTEIVQAARSHAEYALRLHRVAVLDRSNNHAVLVDPRLVTNALAHLLENAAQYSPEESLITVTDQVTADGLLVSVQDEGPGIAAADFPHLFERFYRGAHAHRNVSGTGMGLAITRGLLAAAGGRVWADEVERGAVFSIFVPAEVRVVAED
jgi:K+-sensing histidine kinase KdpD